MQIYQDERTGLSEAKEVNMNLGGCNEKKLKCELYNDSMQSWKCYPIQKAQLIIADIPYNVGNNFYGSNPVSFNGRCIENGRSDKADKAAFYSDYNFNLYEYFHFCSRMMKKEPKKGGGAREIVRCT